MMRVPEIDPAREPFVADNVAAVGARAHSPNAHHVIALPGREDGAIRQNGVLLAGFGGAPVRADRQTGAELRRELEAARRRNAAFDDANTRNAVTAMHERGDAFEAELEKLDGAKADDIGKRVDSFLAEQERDLAAGLTSNRQKAAFAHAFSAYGEGLRERAKQTRERKIREYRMEATERQNRIFLREAVKRENLFNDALQIRLRDMSLFNLDNLYDDMPEETRREKLDACAREFYRVILQKRLESNPEQTKTMLDAPAVRRVLGEAYLDVFGNAVERAIRDDIIRAAAKEWADRDLDAEQAAKRASEAYPDETERRAALDCFALFRYRRHRDEAVRVRDAMILAWKEIRAGGDQDDSIPESVRRNDPELYAFLALQMQRRRQNGGIAPAPDYGCFLALLEGFDPLMTAERFRSGSGLYETVNCLGGPDSRATEAFWRLFTGASTEADAAWFADLRHAGEEAEKMHNRPSPPEEKNRFLKEFDESRNARLERDQSGRMTRLEVRNLARAILNDLATISPGADSGAE